MREGLTMPVKPWVGAWLAAAGSALSMIADASAQDAYYSGAGNRRNYTRAGHGEVSLTYQNSHTNGLQDNSGFHAVGETFTHAVQFEGDINLTNRLSLNAGLPYIIKKFEGAGQHNPASIIPPQNSKFIDDGKYHSGFQDAHIGARYLVLDSDFKIEPFVTFSFPASDYPFFAAAAIGQHRKHFEFGVGFAYYPPLDDYFASLTVSRVRVQRTLDLDTDHWRVGFDAGYFVLPDLVLRGTLQVKQGGGLRVPDDFAVRNDLLWYHHDQLLVHNYINAGGAIDWMIDDHLTLTGSFLKQIRRDNIFALKYALSFAITRSF
jgi:hypothetical protein